MLAAAVLQVYLVAEDKVLKVTPPNVRAAKPASEVFFSYNATPGRSQEIVGLSVAGSYSFLFLTIRNLGLFVFSLEGDLQWTGAKLHGASLVHVHHGKKYFSSSFLDCNGECTRVILILASPLPGPAAALWRHLLDW